MAAVVSKDAIQRRLAGKSKKKKKGNWIAGAVKHPGALRASAAKAGAMKGGKINPGWIAKQTHSSNPTMARRANLAQTFAKMRRS